MVRDSYSLFSRVLDLGHCIYENMTDYILNACQLNMNKWNTLSQSDMWLSAATAQFKMCNSEHEVSNINEYDHRYANTKRHKVFNPKN